MGIFGLFESSSKVDNKTSVSDQRIGAEGGDAIRAQTAGQSTLVIGSDTVAVKAIDSVQASARDSLSASTGFLEKAFTEVLQLTDSRLKSADANFRSSQDFAANIIDKEQETSDDRLIKVVTGAMLGLVVIVAIQNGMLKGVLK